MSFSIKLHGDMTEQAIVICDTIINFNDSIAKDNADIAALSKTEAIIIFSLLGFDHTYFDGVDTICYQPKDIEVFSLLTFMVKENSKSRGFLIQKVISTLTIYKGVIVWDPLEVKLPIWTWVGFKNAWTNYFAY